MTSANIDAIKQSVQAFKGLDIDDQLAALASIYTKAASSIPPETLGTPSPEVSGLVTKIEQLSHQEQVDALRDLLPAKKTDQDEVILDPNPSKALAELVKGGTKVPTHEYGALSTESKLAFLYQIGQKLGKSIIGIPSDYSPSSKVTDLLNSLASLDVQQQMSFLTKVI